MPPRMLNSVHRNNIKHLDNPLNNQLSCRRFDHRNIDAWIQHPIFPIYANNHLQCLVNSNINRLAKRSTSTRDLLHFYTKLLDCLHRWCHHVSTVGIQHKQWNNICRCHFNEWLENILNPFNHCPFIHPCIFLKITFKPGDKFGNSLFAIRQFSVLVKISIGRNFEPSAHTDVARVALLCHSLQYECSLILFLSIPVFSLSSKCGILESDPCKW